MSEDRVVIGVTGASGALYAVRTIRAFVLAGWEVDLVVSTFGARLLRDEAGLDLEEESVPEFLGRTEAITSLPGRVVRYDANDLGAPVSSGSYPVRGMVVVPCSTKTLSGIAHGSSLNLIERAADVTLKERRTLVVVPRETPVNLVHLRNMVAVTEAGAMVIPASPAFYQKPETFEDLADFIAGRVLNLFGIRQSLFTPWGMDPEEE
jgi:4-hydroxy-3-polyprenylbenzoate decarboxylase